MFHRASSIFVLVLPVLAAATAIPRNGSGPSNQCNTGTLQCCSSTQSATSASSNLLLGLLGIVLGPVEGLLGLGCSPITVVGASGTSCSEQPVCCTGNTFNGLVTLGCSPINLNL